VSWTHARKVTKKGGRVGARTEGGVEEGEGRAVVVGARAEGGGGGGVVVGERAEGGGGGGVVVGARAEDGGG